MLEGKPSVQDEAVTMDAIKSILTDFEPEVAVMPKPKRKAKVSQNQDIPALQPVAVVEAKVATARFTTVPSAYTTNAMVRQTTAAMAPRKSGNDFDTYDTQVAAGVQTADDKTPKSKGFAMRMPKISLPKFWTSKRVSETDAPVADTPAPMSAVESNQAPKALITPARLGLAALVLGIVLWPGTALFMAVLAAFVVGCIVMMFGTDAIWNRVRAAIEWYCARNPENRDAVYDRLDDLAVAWDNFLDRFPEGSVDGLYMPDFANLEELERQHEATVADRLERMHQQV